MYKIVLYILIAFILIATILSFFGLLSYNPIALLFSVFFITTICLVANIILAWAFNVPANVESVYITALILSLIITPLASIHDMNFFSLAIWASLLAMASKYILAISRKHVFNPAAIAVAITAVTIGQSASWWIGTLWMTPFVLVGGFLITRKIRRFDLVISFSIVAILTILISMTTTPASIFTDLWRIISSTPLFFFATIMLTEPLTTPPTKWLRILYGAIVGFLFSPAIHIGAVYSTPELALVAGNVFSYIVSPKEKLILKLKEVVKVANDTYNFVFTPNRLMKFKPGQYLEWTIPDIKADSRGNRRYFTIASSPTEDTINMGVKFYSKPSSFKQYLISLKKDDAIIASQRAGDFSLPRNKNKKLVFIAGGIGVTPFRSMIKYLIDKKEKRDIVIFYSNKTIADVAYSDIFDEAYEELGINTVYTLTDLATIPDTWKGRKGFVNAEMMFQEVPDLQDRIFYISGPHAMVTNFEDVLSKIGIEDSRIKKDFFPGFA